MFVAYDRKHGETPTGVARSSRGSGSRTTGTHTPKSRVMSWRSCARSALPEVVRDERCDRLAAGIVELGPLEALKQHRPIRQPVPPNGPN